MKTQRRHQKFSINNERGVLTLDFIFAITISMGLMTILLAVSWTLSVFEVTQYVSFAVARNYAAAHISEQEQKAQAVRKYNQLTKENRVLAALYSSSWFTITSPDQIAANIGNFNEEFPQDGGEQFETFVGARVDITAHALEIKFPMLGNTYEEEGGFKTQLSSYLIRSPSENECLEFNRARFNQLKDLDPAYSAAQGTYAVVSDNGC